MKHKITIYLQFFLFILLLLPIAYGHEEGAQAISKESLEGPLYAFIIIVLAIIAARFIKKYYTNQKIKGGKKHGREK